MEEHWQQVINLKKIILIKRTVAWDGFLLMPYYLGQEERIWIFLWSSNICSVCTQLNNQIKPASHKDYILATERWQVCLQMLLNHSELIKKCRDGLKLPFSLYSLYFSLDQTKPLCCEGMLYSLAYTMATEADKFACNADKITYSELIKVWNEHTWLTLWRSVAWFSLHIGYRSRQVCPHIRIKSLGTHKSGLSAPDHRWLCEEVWHSSACTSSKM